MIGMPLFLKKATSDSGLNSALLTVFDSEESSLVLDLAAYSFLEETDACQHYPSYGFHNALFSETVVSDSTISRFCKKRLSLPLHNSFWMNGQGKMLVKGRCISAMTPPT